MIKTEDLFTFENCLAHDLLSSKETPWEILPLIGEYVIKFSQTLNKEDYSEVVKDVFIHKTAILAPSVELIGPAIIGPNVELRASAFIRGKVIIEHDALIGNSCELKNVIVLPYAQIAHFNYVGDSILGQYAHLGAGAITSNVKGDRTLVSVKYNGESIPTGLKKFGALLADNTEVGCNAVLNPGTIIGKESRVYPLSMVRGTVPAASIYKNDGSIIKILE